LSSRPMSTAQIVGRIVGQRMQLNITDGVERFIFM
jgi:hypothetical protein